MPSRPELDPGSCFSSPLCPFFSSFLFVFSFSLFLFIFGPCSKPPCEPLSANGLIRSIALLMAGCCPDGSALQLLAIAHDVVVGLD